MLLQFWNRQCFPTRFPEINIGKHWTKKRNFVDLKSNTSLLYNKGHNFWKVFWPEKFPKTDYCPYCLPPTSGGQAGNKEQDRKINNVVKGGRKICCKEISSPTFKNAWRNIPFWIKILWMSQVLGFRILSNRFRLKSCSSSSHFVPSFLIF